MDNVDKRKASARRMKRRLHGADLSSESKTLSVRLPKPLFARLESRAEAMGESPSMHLKRIAIQALQDEASARILVEVQAVRAGTERILKNLKQALIAMLMNLDHTKAATEDELRAMVEALLGR